MRNGFLGEGGKRGRSEEQGQLNHHHQLRPPHHTDFQRVGQPAKRKIETCLTSTSTSQRRFQARWHPFTPQRDRDRLRGRVAVEDGDGPGGEAKRAGREALHPWPITPLFALRYSRVWGAAWNHWRLVHILLSARVRSS